MTSPDFYCETCDECYFEWEHDKHLRCTIPGAIVSKPSEPIALVDLDGTLADFDKEMKGQLAKLAAPGEDIEAEGYTKLPHIQERWDLIKRQPGFWKNLDPIPLGFDILSALRQLKFTIHVLTKGPVNTTRAWTEKVEWCRDHVPLTPVTIGEDKGLMYGKVLVDDWPSYYMRWLEWRPRGLVIVPAQPWNKDVDHPNCVRATSDNLEEVFERLEKVRATAGPSSQGS